jgi:4-diphosphocytidyl-2-C-methyl-D-erythritol kinase
MKIKAYAKINIGLNILGKRQDGYHDLETVFHRIDLADEILLEPSSTIGFTCDSSGVPSDDSNLCLRAAHLLQQECGTLRGVQVSLTKRIPIGAGLGGGSSDAATTLLGLNKFWGLNLSRQNLQTLALKLGSDVPYFLHYNSARASGRGEILEYFPLDLPFWILLVYPMLQVPTTWAYGQLRSTEYSGNRLTKEFLLATLHQPEKLRTSITNDFEPPVFKQYPELKEIKESLVKSGAIFALMSGSGSAVYGFFPDYKKAQALSTDLAKRYQIFITPPHFQPTE